jgi:hypothetical protein
MFSPPFTLQRLCEVLCEPERYYQTAAKLTRGVHKVLLVDPKFNAFLTPSSATGSELDEMFDSDEAAMEESSDTGGAEGEGAPAGQEAHANGASGAPADARIAADASHDAALRASDVDDATPVRRVSEKRGRSPDEDDTEGDAAQLGGEADEAENATGSACKKARSIE